MLLQDSCSRLYKEMSGTSPERQPYTVSTLLPRYYVMHGLEFKVAILADFNNSQRLSFFQ